MLSAVARGVSEDFRADMPTSSGALRDRFEFGVFGADGIEVLVSEINAIAQLKDVSRTDEQQKAPNHCGEKPSPSPTTLSILNCSTL